SATRSRVGRVERTPAPQGRRLLGRAWSVFQVRGVDGSGGDGRARSSSLSDRSAAGSVMGAAPQGSLDRSRVLWRAPGALSRARGGFLLQPSQSSAGAPARAGALPPAHELHV